MGVIQIRRSSASLDNLPGVRAIDTSGLADTSHGALSKAAENISHGVRTAVKSIGDLAEFRMRDDERAANEAYIKADAILQDRVYNPKDGILKSFEDPSDNAASNYIRDPNTSVIDALKTKVRKDVEYNKLSGPQQRIFDEKINADLTSIRKVLGASADKIVTTRSRNASQGMLDLYTQRCINDPSAENRALLIKAFEENARTQNLTETEAFVAKVALQLKIAEGAASNVIANCQSIEDLNLVGKSLQYVRNKESYGKRTDGTIKGIGWLGPLKSKDGEIVTEYSIGVSLDGVEREIPLVVPTLSQQEVDFLLNELVPARNDKALSKRLRETDLYEKIERKAIEHAKPLLESGRSPFFAGAFGEFTEAAKDLPPEMLDTLERGIKKRAKEQYDKIAKAKAEEAAQQEAAITQEVDTIESSFEAGAITYAEVNKAVNDAKEAGIGYKHVERLQKVKEKAINKEVNEWCAILEMTPDLVGTKRADGSEIAIPDYIKQSPVFQLRLKTAQEKGWAAEKKIYDESIRATLDIFTTRNVALGDTIEQRNAAVQDLANRGYITQAKADETKRKINAYHSDRLRHFVNTYGATFGNFFSIVHLQTEDANAELRGDTVATYNAVYKRFEKLQEDPEGLEVARQLSMALSDGWNDFYTWTTLNPNATPDEMTKAFNQRMQPLLEVINNPKSFTFEAEDFHNKTIFDMFTRANNSFENNVIKPQVQTGLQHHMTEDDQGRVSYSKITAPSVDPRHSKSNK